NNGSSGDDPSTGTTDEALVADDSEGADMDDDAESGMDEPLSGAPTTDPGSPAQGASDDELLEKVRTNAGLFFKPAGCLQSTRSGNKITHVFGDCSGPDGLVHFKGTVTSTYVRGDHSLTITHDASGFGLNGAEITGQRVIEYTWG